MTRQYVRNLIGLPFDRLRPLVCAALKPDGVSGEVIVDAVNRRGRGVVVRVACAPSGGRAWAPLAKVPSS